jgi:hypothetical protein
MSATRNPRSSRSPRAPRFEQEQVEVSLLTIYLGLHMGGNAIDPYRGELEGALIRAGERKDRLGLIRLALSGMPQAIVPFHRRLADIHLAVSLMDDLGRTCFRTEGSAVDAGYFMWVGDEVRYIDESSDNTTRVPEVLDPFATRSLLHDLSLWTRKPQLEVLDSAQGDLLRLIPGTDRFGCLKIMPPARKQAANLPQPATVSLLKVGPKPQERGDAPQVSRVALGQVTLVRDEGSLLMQQVAPEFLMELHAASLARPSPGQALFLHVDLLDSQFLSPLPDLLEPGAIAQGWWAPLRDISNGLGGSWHLSATLPRSTVIALMQNAPWMWSKDLGEWARCAWLLTPTEN